MTLGSLKITKYQKRISRQDNSDFMATVFIPQKKQRYAVVVFAHGFFHDPWRYNSLMKYIASWGYIVVAPHSHNGVWPNHKGYARDLGLCMEYVRKSQQKKDSIFFERYNGKGAIIGHSMGGGAALLAAVDAKPRLVVTYAAAETTPSAKKATQKLTCPAVFVISNNDKVISNSDIHQMYDMSKHEAWKIGIRGAWHCGYEDVSYLGCDSGTLARQQQIDIAKIITVVALKCYVDKVLTRQFLQKAFATDFLEVKHKNNAP
ncbi:alpha/beta hydrolase [Candidatus Uabimicrobium amorphum]|uniref:alpha/beta hydrolase n=1 Tax=Uabimicrobium amorphum TaxID=2596890 RepID=UPI00125F9390|nr:alpha/beta hydrolase [Candidatus Uabimicrobium amorphum]